MMEESDIARDVVSISLLQTSITTAVIIDRRNDWLCKQARIL
jgi:hypothetical protein